MERSAIIIGGGIGGLFTGALLAKNGLRVTLLEKNAIIGGGLQCFSRGGKLYETGMHVMGGFGPTGTLTRICRYLGIMDSLDIHHIDPSCMRYVTARTATYTGLLPDATVLPTACAVIFRTRRRASGRM